MTPTCVAPRHVDAPRVFFFFFFSERAARARGGGTLPDFFFFFFPCSADHERDWPPCKVVFFELAANALNARNKNNNNSGQFGGNHCDVLALPVVPRRGLQQCYNIISVFILV